MIAMMRSLLPMTVLLVGCASPLPPITWVRLPAEAVTSPAASSPSREVWQLMLPVVLPGHLDRDALLVPQGRAALAPLGGVRWAEPLRDAVPRLLRHDLARAFGAPVWTTPLPPGVLPTRQLRVEFAALEVGSDGRSISLRARWSLADPRGATPPALHDATFDLAAAGTDADALAAAHREAIARLAAHIAQSAR